MEHVVLYSLFVLFSFSAALEPGPGFVSLSVNTVRNGRVGGNCAALGFFVGALPYVVLVTAGLSWLINTIPGVLGVLKIAAACYLLWLAINMLRNVNSDNAAEVPQRREFDSGWGQWIVWPAFWNGFLLVMLNPRTLVFYSTFLPLFYNESLNVSASLQVFLLGVSVALIFLITDLIFVALLFQYSGRLKEKPALKKISRYIGSAILAAVGVKLILESK